MCLSFIRSTNHRQNCIYFGYFVAVYANCIRHYFAGEWRMCIVAGIVWQWHSNTHTHAHCRTSREFVVQYIGRRPTPENNKYWKVSPILHGNRNVGNLNECVDVLQPYDTRHSANDRSTRFHIGSIPLYFSFSSSGLPTESHSAHPPHKFMFDALTFSYTRRWFVCGALTLRSLRWLSWKSITEERRRSRKNARKRGTSHGR